MTSATELQQSTLQLPAPTRERWQPLRSGLLNLFRYDHEEFWWEQGHLLLRGNNGTGKSRVLALQLPFLLDGEVAPNRLEPDGDAAKRIEWNLLMGRYPDRLGYTWLEFGRRDPDGAEHYLTLGCGLHATEGRGLVNRWFFITPQRVGRDLFLQTTTGQALTRDRLAEALGSAGELFPTATAYRRAIDAKLFKLGEQRYDALVTLLIELRKPQLSRALEEENLSRALSDALAPPSDAILADVADSFRSLETDRAHLNGFVAASGAVRAFLHDYQRYAAVAARRRAEAVRSAHADYEATLRKLRAAEEDLKAAGEEHATAEGDVKRLALEAAQLDAEIESLSASPAARSAEELNRLAKAAEHDARRARDAAEEAKSARSALANAERVRDRAREQLESARSAVLAKDGAAAQHAARCGLGELHRGTASGPMEAAARDAGEASAAARVTASLAAALARLDDAAQRRLEAAKHLTRRSHEVEGALQKVQSALEAQTQAERERDEELNRQISARKAQTAASQALLGAYREWCAAARELAPEAADALEAAHEVWCERAEGRSPVARAVDVAFEAAAAKLASERAAVRARREVAVGARDELAAERARLLAGEHRPPPAPHTRDEARRAQRPGAPLWKLCDFAPGLGARERAGLEAGLEAAGLLDAWVTPDGQLLGAGDHDTALVCAGTPLAPAGRALSTVLVPAVDGGDARAALVSEAVVADVLRHLGWGEGAGDVWVAADGRWQVGPLRGAWEKGEPEHLGEGSREKRRRKRIEELSRALAEAEAAIAGIERELSAIDARSQAARLERDGAPGDAAVRDAAALAAAAAEAVDRARGRLARIEAQTAKLRKEHEQLRERRDREARELGVEAWLDDLRGLEDAAQAYLLAIREVRTDLRLWDAAAQEHARAEDAWRNAVAASQRMGTTAQEAAQRAAAAHRAFEALEGTVGVEAREVTERLRASRARLITARADADAARDRATRAFGRMEAASARIAALTETVESEVRVREHALQVLARFVSTRLLAVADTSLAEVEGGAWSATRGVEIARKIENALRDVDADDAAWERNQGDIHRHLETLVRALDAHQLRPSYEPVDDVLVVSAAFQGRPRTMDELAQDLNAEITVRQSVLNAREREVIENHLLGEVATHLHERLRAAEKLVGDMNEEIQARPTSTGMKLRFVWGALEAEMPELAEARKRLLRRTATWSPQERERVGAFLQARIERVRHDHPDGTWQEHLRQALDYRAWHRFSVERFQDGTWKRLTKRTHGTGSGGEKAIALTIPKFAAAAAHYKSADPLAPRLILLDEAFVGVDSDMRSKSMGLLHTFDLDFLLTSEREWGCYPTLPGLAIYQLATRAGIDAVGVTRWIWNGRERAHAVHQVSPPAPPEGERSAATAAEG